MTKVCRKRPSKAKLKAMVDASITTISKKGHKGVIDAQSSMILDKAAEGIKVERPIVQKTWRRQGRPSGGFTLFKRSQIDAIPEVGGPSEVADALHIARASLHQWCNRKKNPLPFATENGGAKLFRRDVVIKWLKATRHYKP